ncbi:MAG: hypothetical protein NC420_07950 [Eubacterium sp.]|nr:hypothetical protein [Eubacterium sp.]MCM1216953.1 hypothetical protein [Lachnospiraceae bacterium]MCM1303994.1 hypothetical protein [Butyrivibrio sp.]MCM1344740.1 hypothetical protein [Muribaculaceae bacterium]MCM1240642.1 hypothetical protein [Lachnospiraceae bacterium]
MAKLIITVEGGKFTQTLSFLDRNIKDNRYIYENGNESGIMEDPEEVYEDVPECSRIAEQYEELLKALDLGKRQITGIMRQLNALEKTMDPYVIPSSDNGQEHVITLDNGDLDKLARLVNVKEFENDKNIEDAVRALIRRG